MTGSLSTAALLTGTTAVVVALVTIGLTQAARRAGLPRTLAASVAAEARQQLGRLATHPCLTLLCGNSEGEQQAAMWGAPRQSWSPRV